MKQSKRFSIKRAFAMTLAMLSLSVITVQAADGAKVDINGKSIAQIESEISAALTGMTSGSITVSGSKTDAALLTITIPANVTVKWQANYAGNGGIMANGTGTFNVDGGTVKISGNGNAIQSAGNVTVSGNAVVSACAGNAIRAEGAKSVITVSGGTITRTSDCSSTANSVIYTTDRDYPNYTTVTVSGGTVENAGSGYAIQSSGDITVSGNAVIKGVSGNVIQAEGATNTVNVNGGTVENNGSGMAIYTSGGDVMVSGNSVVSAQTGIAIRPGQGEVTINGGTVRATTPVAIQSNGWLAINGGVVFAYGNGITSIITHNVFTGKPYTGNGVIIAWDNTAGNTYTTGTTNGIYIANGTAYWSNTNGGGIYYKNGSNEGFIPISGVTVKAN